MLYYIPCSEGCCNDAPGSSEICPFYFVIGDKIVTYGMGIEIIDIKEMNKESMTLVFSGYEHTFFDYSCDRNI